MTSNEDVRADRSTAARSTTRFSSFGDGGYTAQLGDELNGWLARKIGLESLEQIADCSRQRLFGTIQKASSQRNTATTYPLGFDAPKRLMQQSLGAQFPSRCDRLLRQQHQNQVSPKA
jgi:hypothetical protein